MLSDMKHLVIHAETVDGTSTGVLITQYHTNTNFSAGVAAVLGTKKETGTGVVTESESVIENVTEKILLVGKVRECLEDAENTPGAGRGTRNARGNGKGTETTETDTANLVSFHLIYILI